MSPDKVEAPGCHAGPEENKDAHGDDARIGRPPGENAHENDEDAKSQDIGNSLDEDRPPVAENEVCADVGLPRLIDSKEQVVCVLTRAVHEVVEAVSRETNTTILQGSHWRTLASPGDVCLHGSSSRVGRGDNIGIVGPDVAEKELERRVFVLKR